MADRNPETSKKNSHSRKKKRNKSSKKKSQNKSSLQSSEKSIFFGKEKGIPLNEKGKFSELTTSESDLFTFDRSAPKHQDYHFPRGRTQTFSPFKLGMRNDKHNNSNFSPNRLSNNNSPGAPNFHHENLCGDKLTFNKFANDISRIPENVDLVQRIEYLTNQVDFLSRENIRLSDCLHNSNSNWSIHSDSEVDIIFKKKHLEEKFSHVLKKLVSNLLRGHIKVEKLNQFFNLSNCEEKEKSEELDQDCLFAVDPSADLNESATCIPVYDASFQEILENPNDSKNASPLKKSGSGRGAVSCFNCDADHHLSSCPQKPDFRRIASARKKAKSFYVPSVRYHVHGKNESEFKPGNISDELREALGIQKHQIPLYVYRMRVLDYPPGWLSEAAVESSGMILYDSEGNALKEENCEEGEVDTSAVKVQYDPDKLINYPGFNVPPPPDVIEESEQFGLPPLQPQQLRSYVEKFMAKPDVRPSRKRKIDLPSDRASKMQRSEEDMEIEEDADEGVISSKIKVVSEFVPPLPASEPPPPPPPPIPPPPGEDSETSQDVLNNFPSSFIEENSASLFETPLSSFKVNSCSDFSSGTSSPSLAELVELKKKLVQELGTSIEEEPSHNPVQEDESSLNTDINEDLTSDGLYVFDECVASDASNLSNVSRSDSEGTEINDSETLTRTTSQSKCVALGTPSLSCHSPYSKLPNYEQFSKNVSAHMPFENLPNSTGAYERMKNVLKTVKSKFNSLMK